MILREHGVKTFTPRVDPVERLCERRQHLSGSSRRSARPVSTLCNGPWTDTVVFPTLWSVNVFYEREKACEERRWVRRPGISNLLNRKAWQWRKWADETVHLPIRVPPATTHFFFFMCRKVKIIIKTLLVLECITAFPEAWWGAFEKPREMVAWQPATFIHQGAWASHPHSVHPEDKQTRSWVQQRLST